MYFPYVRIHIHRHRHGHRYTHIHGHRHIHRLCIVYAYTMYYTYMQQEQQQGSELRLLYQYEHENRQLTLHIQTLTGRLHEIMNRPQAQVVVPSPIDQHRQSLLTQQLKRLYQEMEKLNAETEGYRRKINELQESKCVHLENAIRSEQIEIIAMQRDASLMKKHERKNTDDKEGREANHTLLNQYREQLLHLKREIKELTHKKNDNERKIRKEHVNKFNKPVKEYDGGLTYTQIDLWRIQREVERMEKQTNIGRLPKIQKQLRKITIEKKQTHAKVNKTPMLRKSVDTSMTIVPTPMVPKINSMHEGQTSFNDKNIKQKQPKKVQWGGSGVNGVDWNDSQLKSHILGANIWIDKRIIGVQFLFEAGESQQHLFLTRAMNPIQYRLAGNDVLSNVVLTLKENSIVGLQFDSKGGRMDYFGIQKGKKFDFGGSRNEKIVNSYGKYRIHENMSEIICLGFEFI